MTEKYKLIENLGRGNCGYLSYSLSLAAYLGSNPDEIGKFFAKLNLTVSEQLALRECFKPENFNLKHNRDLIQSLIGEKLRQKAVTQVGSEFTESPFFSPNYATIAWEIRKSFYQQLSEDKRKHLKSQLLQSDAGGVFSNAEVLKTPGLKDFLNDGVVKCLQQVTGSETEEQLDNLVNQVYIDSFLPNKACVLDFFALDRKWASTDEIMALHRAINMDIPLQFLRNGRPIYGEISQTGLVLNNVRNCHWQSFVPIAYSCTGNAGKPSVNYYKALKILENLDSDDSDFLTSYEGLVANPNLQKAVIALRQTGVDFKDDWEQLKDNPNLQKAVIALGKAGVDFKENWQQLLKTPDYLAFAVNKLNMVGLDRAKEATSDSKKNVMGDFLKKRIGTDAPAAEILKNSARVMSHHTNWFKSRSTTTAMPRAYQAAASCFDEARKLLAIDVDEWNRVLKDKPSESPNRSYQTYSFFKDHIDKETKTIWDNTPLAPTV